MKEKTRIFNRISLKSAAAKNDSSQKTSEVINVDNIDHAMFILDSILNKNGVPVYRTKCTY